MSRSRPFGTTAAVRYRSRLFHVSTVSFTDHAFVLHLADGCILFVPLLCVPGLAAASCDVRRNCRILADGRIAWPDLRQEFDVSALLAAAPPHGAATAHCE